MARDDILLPKPVVERMLREIPTARVVDIEDVNHYGIIFRPNAVRDKAIIDFLEDQETPA